MKTGHDAQAAVAQAVAHLIGSEEVTGSIPVNSLKALDFFQGLFFFPLYDSKVFATLVSELIIVQLNLSTDSITITFALFNDSLAIASSRYFQCT